MRWLNNIVDEAIKRKPKGEILIASGGSPSGEYHIGHLRELVICDAIWLELKNRGRKAKHIYYVDDLDGLRKIPANVPTSFEKYLGRSLSDIPSPDGSKLSYADYFLAGLQKGCDSLGVEVEFVRSHKKYRSGFFISKIEESLSNANKIKQILESVSGHKLSDSYSPIQVNEDGYLKKRKFISLDKKSKTLVYEDKDGNPQSIKYDGGDVKLDWRIDWAARWALLQVDVEPFGRDHASAGGSYDTGKEIVEKVFGASAPLPVKYDFINLHGDTKKMSASKGSGLSASESADIIPSEIMRYFVLNAPPNKLLHFDPIGGLVRLIDEYAVLLAKTSKSESEKQLIRLCGANLKQRTVSSVPFSHLVESYQSSLKNFEKTLDIIARTEYQAEARKEKGLIKKELKFIDNWLQKWAPEDVKFKLKTDVNPSEFTEKQKKFLSSLADVIAGADGSAGGEWFHKAIYDLKDKTGLEPKELFQTIYKATIGKDSGPRAGWFLSTLPRDWLIDRLRLRK